MLVLSKPPAWRIKPLTHAAGSGSLNTFSALSPAPPAGPGSASGPVPGLAPAAHSSSPTSPIPSSACRSPPHISNTSVIDEPSGKWSRSCTMWGWPDRCCSVFGQRQADTARLVMGCRLTQGTKV